MNNSSMKIMTLNVNGFRGNENKTVSDDIRLNNMRQIMQLVDEVIINKNDIIILQEIPHMIRESGTSHWYDNHPLYISFKEMFKEYKVLEPKHLKDSDQYTVALCKKNSSWEQLSKDVLQYDKGFLYGNKFVELQCGKITLLGVHMPVNNRKWDKLISTLNSTPYSFVVGDFNANEKRNRMSDKPKKIRNCGYNNFIPNNIITCYSYKTSIDNIYVNSKFTMKKNTEVNVMDTNLTDHALCILEYDF